MTEHLSTPVNLDAMLDQIIERMHEVVPFDGGGIAVYDAASGLLAPRRYHAAQSDAPLPRLFRLGEGLIGQVAQSRQPERIDDVLTRGDCLPYALETRSQLAVPMVLGDELLGVLSAESHDVAAYTVQHQIMLCALADQTALALHIAGLYETLAERYERLNEYTAQLVTRNEISQLASAEQAGGEPWPELALRLTHLSGAEGSALTLWEESTASTRLLTVVGLSELDHLDWNNLTRNLAEGRRPTILNSAWSLDLEHVPERENSVRAVLALPLIARGRFIGAAFLVNLTENRPFTNADVELVASALDQIALAIDNQTLLQNIQKQLSETAVLLEIAGIASSNLDLDTMLSHVFQLCQKILNISVGTIMIYDPKTDTLLPRAGSGFGFSADVLAMARFPASAPDSHIAMTFRSASGRITNNVLRTTHEQYQDLAHRIGVSNLMYAALRVQDTRMGLILVGGKPSDFTQNDLDLLDAIGSHVAAALRNAELLNQMRHRLRETEALQRIAAITSATLDLDDMIERAVIEAAGLLEASGAFVLMPDSSGEWLIPHIRSLYGISQEHTIRPLRVDDTGPLAAVFTSGESYIERHASVGTATGSTMIACPLSSHNRTLGVLVLRNRTTGDFEAVHVDLLHTIASQIAVSMENAGLFATERRRADLLALINQIGQELTATLDLPGLIRKTVRNIHELLGYDAVCLYLVDEGGTTVTAQASAARTAPMRIADGFSFPISQGFVGRAVRTGQVQLAPNVLSDPDFFWPTREHQAASDLALPLRSREQIVGVLEIVSSHINDFQEADRMALETLATQISTAVENARLWDQAQRRLLEQGIVHQIGQDLTSILEYDELIDAVVRHMTRALDTAVCLLIGYDQQQVRLIIEAEYRTSEVSEQLGTRRIGHLPDEIERKLIDQAMNTRRPAFYYRDEALAQFSQTAPLSAPGLNAAMTLPTIAGDRITGCMIWLETRGPRRFSESDLRLAQTLTSQAAIAIENAQLYRQAQRQAYEQALLRRVAVGLSVISDLDGLLTQFAREIVQVLAADNVVIALLDSPSVFRVKTQALNTRTLQDTALGRIRLPMPAMFGVLQGGVTLQCTSMTLENGELSDAQLELSAVMVDLPYTSIFTPIARRGETIGLIEVSRDDPMKPFDASVVALLEALASQGAVAIDNARLFTELEKRAVELEKANQLKSEFLARISHELRTPMNSINGYSDLLLREQYGTLTAKQADRIERILRNGHNLLALIDDLLDISKIEAGQMDLHLEPLDLPVELQATLETLETQATARGLYMHVNVSPDLPPVMADSTRLRQVVTNLIGNAVKFTRTGGITVEAQAQTIKNRPVVLTRVIDTGIGIKAEDQTIIFDEFRQVDGSATRQYGGTGLGLAIAKKLLELMDGTIWVESALGSGSTFSFVLPVAAVADVQSESADRNTR